MDALSELLSSVRARAASWIRVEAKAPWGVAIPARPSTLAIHHVISGPVAFSASASASASTSFDDLVAATGEVVVIPHGRAHVLRDRRGSPVIALAQAGVQQLTLGGAEVAVTSALIELDDPFAIPLVSSLPSRIKLAADGALLEALQLVAKELEARAFGSDLVLARMADVLFIQMMRAYIASFPGEQSHACRSLELASAIRDPGVATALGLMSGQPERPWTVASLAAQAGLSRSAFAARFTSLVGEPPLGFLTRMRMQKATMLLGEGAPLAQITQLTGYASEASFSHAFRQWSGVAPGAYRKRSSQPGKPPPSTAKL